MAGWHSSRPRFCRALPITSFQPQQPARGNVARARGRPPSLAHCARDPRDPRCQISLFARRCTGCASRNPISGPRGCRGLAQPDVCSRAWRRHTKDCRVFRSSGGFARRRRTFLDRNTPAVCLMANGAVSVAATATLDPRMEYAVLSRPLRQRPGADRHQQRCSGPVTTTKYCRQLTNWKPPPSVLPLYSSRLWPRGKQSHLLRMPLPDLAGALKSR